MAEASDIFSSSGPMDWASAWLEALFHSGHVPTGLTETSTAFTGLSGALRQALGLYSIGMLVLAGFLLLWHIVALVAETAHTGVPMGRRTNQLWAPLRFVLAMGLLVPLSGGLNTGQFLIVKLADQGSSLASRAWRGIVTMAGPSLSAPVMPREPNVTPVVMTAVEMELCRGLYQNLFTTLQPDPLLARIGAMGDLRKTPSDRLGEENWRYTNDLFSDIALCGEYRFASPEAVAAADRGVRVGDEEAFEKNTQALAESTRVSTERLAFQSRMLADRVATHFLVPHGDAVAPEAGATLGSFINDQRKIIQNGIKAQMPKIDAEAKSERLSSMGWIGAGEWLLETARQQTALGSSVTRILPDVKAPLFGHRIFSRAVWMGAVEKDSALRLSPALETTRYGAFYDKMTLAMRQARAWLYKNQIQNLRTSPPDQLDLSDRLGAYSDGAQGLRVFTRLLHTGFESWGIFTALNNDDAMDQDVARMRRDMVEKPFSSLIETGRRLMEVGAWLFGMTGPALAEPATMASAILFAVLAFALLCAGGALVFLVPFLPFYRYLVAVVLWFLSVFAAVAALPLVALAHLNPTGEGLVGPVARRAYWLWLAVFMRPILTLFGFVMGGLLLYFGVVFLNTLFVYLVAPFTSAGSDAFVFTRVGFALVYAVLVVAVTNASFRGVTSFPAGILDWLSGQGGLPETIVLNGAASAARGGALAVQALPAASSGHGVAEAEAQKTLIANGHNGAPARGGAEAGVSKVSKTTEAAHFPTIAEPQEKPVVIAKAEARAFARAEGAEGGATSAAAVASARSSGPDSQASAKAISLHLPSIKEPDVKGRDPHLLAPEEDGRKGKKDNHPVVPPHPSREQSAVTDEGLKPRETEHDSDPDPVSKG